MTKPGVLVSAGAVLLAGTVATAIVSFLRPGPAAVVTMTVSQQTFVRRVTAEGVLRAVERTSLSLDMRARGPRQIAWIVEDGTYVREGDPVARFDPSDLELQLEDGQLEQQIADHQIDKAEVTREGQRANLDRDADVSRRELDTAERFQAVDTDLYSRHEIIESRIDTELARHKTDHAETVLEIKDRLSATDIDLLKIQRRQAEIRVEEAEEGLDSLVILAPHDGIVMLARERDGGPIQVGDTTWPGREVATLPDVSAMEADVFVLEADAGGLNVGQTALVVVEAHPESQWRAEIRQVDPVATQRLRNVPVQFFRAVLKLGTTDPTIMKPGARVRTEIVVDRIDDAIAVPRQAVHEDGDHNIVYRRGRRGFDAVVVSLGPSSLGRVVVSEGLSDGDVIALENPSDGRSTAAGLEPSTSLKTEGGDVGGD